MVFCDCPHAYVVRTLVGYTTLPQVREIALLLTRQASSSRVGDGHGHPVYRESKTKGSRRKRERKEYNPTSFIIMIIKNWTGRGGRFN
jgi:hypothetical protein